MRTLCKTKEEEEAERLSGKRCESRWRRQGWGGAYMQSAVLQKVIFNLLQLLSFFHFFMQVLRLNQSAPGCTYAASGGKKEKKKKKEAEIIKRTIKL